MSTGKWALQSFDLWDSDVWGKLQSFGAALPVPTRFTHTLSVQSVVNCWFHLQYEPTIAFCNVAACLNESSDIRLLVLYRECNRMAYTQCWYQNGSSNIRPSADQYCAYGLGDSWIAYTYNIVFRMRAWISLSVLYCTWGLGNKGMAYINSAGNRIRALVSDYKCCTAHEV